MNIRKFVIGGLAVVGGGYAVKTLTSYVLKTYRQEIRAVVLDRTVSYFFEDIEEDEAAPEDPLKAAIMAYMDAKKKGAQK